MANNTGRSAKAISHRHFFTFHILLIFYEYGVRMIAIAII
ncbi:hypothetical protein ASZ90_014305 [hydrocarbon metagenome]|uniref:Uncharacterized protein n=1 Tax=hydrocarbon metagenome TaxID=938273 RepID=A0A0W8F4Z0_9ZZZZ